MNNFNQNQYCKLAEEFSTRDFSGSRYLIYREIPKLLNDLQLNKPLALDIGCGAGRSTRFLKDLGYDAIGIDINYSLLSLAKNADKDGIYILTDKEWPFPSNYFELAYCQLVLPELSSKEEIRSLLISSNKVISNNGSLILVTSSPEASRPGEWISISTSFEENSLKPKSGDKVRKLLLPENILLLDYHWEESDIAEIARVSGFELTKSVKFRALETDPYKWKDELKTPPYMAYILRKV